MPSAEMLVNGLLALDLHFVVEKTSTGAKGEKISPQDLLVGLARQDDARLRLALIGLFLYRPELADVVSPALAQLDTAGQTTLKLFYTAAVLLQRIHQHQLQGYVPQWRELPDNFSEELGVTSRKSPQDSLRLLSHRHRELTGLAANWLGTYQYAAKRMITRLEKEAAWAL